MHCIVDWLTKYEPVAVWLEGIALLALLGVELWNGHKDRQETVEQLKLAQDQIRASQNAERAWVMTELVWQEQNALKVAQTTSDGQTYKTSVMVRLHCRNSGRSPAWVEKIVGYCEIVDKPKNVSAHVGHKAEFLGWMEPLGPDVSRFKNLNMQCDGDLTDNNVLAIYIVVEYRDIFQVKRATSLGYIVTTYKSAIHLGRQDERPDRNIST